MQGNCKRGGEKKLNTIMGCIYIFFFWSPPHRVWQKKKLPVLSTERKAYLPPYFTLPFTLVYLTYLSIAICLSSIYLFTYSPTDITYHSSYLSINYLPYLRISLPYRTLPTNLLLSICHLPIHLHTLLTLLINHVTTLPTNIPTNQSTCSLLNVD